MKINILFWLRDGKNINCRVTVNGVKANRPLGISCPRKEWNIITKRTKNPIFNAHLADLEAKLTERHYELLILNKNNPFAIPHSAEQLVSEIIDEVESPIESFEVLANEWLALRKSMIRLYNNEDINKKIGRIEEDTYKNDVSRIRHVNDFVAYGKNKYKNPSFWNNGVAQELEAYIYDFVGGTNHASRIIADVCRVFKYAKDKGYFKYQLVDYSIKKLPSENANKPTLTLKEIEMIENLDLSNESEILQRTKDGILLQAYTGFAHAELTRMERKYVSIDDDPNLDWNEWIIMPRKKTEKRQPKPCVIPLNPKAKAILEKHDYKIKKFHNNDYNANIRAIICRLGIEKDVTSHLFRKSYGDILSEQGVSSETISNTYGHKTTRITETAYIKIKKSRVAREIAPLFKKGKS
ncbi:tyrosine-type recombinase/integrase [Bernardetia sp. MNP-M8]|uniref:tyrosine-type recombinase/integrase n=1 Tax=Bernardetia sp. MNP-M8 TaxID=3127470 RepID=UPI0030CA9037